MATAICVLAAEEDRTRFFEGRFAPKVGASTAPQPEGYLSNSAINFSVLIGPPPTRESPADRDDVAGLERRKTAAVMARWEVAEADNASVYDRFAEAMGTPIEREHTPLLVHLLNRVERDVAKPTFEAKNFYQRPRPYQRFQLEKVCGEDVVPKADPYTTKGSSYPSGHSASGWATALVLAEVAPEHAQAILTRGMDYGESRVVCGAHYPSDVEAGRIIATAVVERLFSSEEFMNDLRCAQWEHNTNSGLSSLVVPGLCTLNN